MLVDDVDIDSDQQCDDNDIVIREDVDGSSSNNNNNNDQVGDAAMTSPVNESYVVFPFELPIPSDSKSLGAASAAVTHHHWSDRGGSSVDTNYMGTLTHCAGMMEPCTESHSSSSSSSSSSIADPLARPGRVNKPKKKKQSKPRTKLSDGRCGGGEACDSCVLGHIACQRPGPAMPCSVCVHKNIPCIQKLAGEQRRKKRAVSGVATATNASASVSPEAASTTQTSSEASTSPPLLSTRPHSPIAQQQQQQQQGQPSATGVADRKKIRESVTTNTLTTAITASAHAPRPVQAGQSTFRYYYDAPETYRNNQQRMRIRKQQFQPPHPTTPSSPPLAPVQPYDGHSGTPTMDHDPISYLNGMIQHHERILYQFTKILTNLSKQVSIIRERTEPPSLAATMMQHHPTHPQRRVNHDRIYLQSNGGGGDDDDDGDDLQLL